MNSRLAASIIVPVFNQVAYTTICLAGLDAADLHGAEVIVVDNGSTDGTADVLDRWASAAPHRQVITMGENTGFARGCNAGARAAAGAHLVFLNNDTFVLPGWLQGLLLPFRSRKVMVTGSKLLYPNGRIQHAGVAFDEAGPHHVFAGLPADHPAVREERDWQAVTAAAMAIRTAEFRRLEGFDEGYLNSFEDVDLCLRVKAAGGRVIYAPASVAYHFESVSEGRLGATDDRNYQRFIERWRGRFHPDLKESLESATRSGWDLEDRLAPKAEALPALRRAEATVAELEERLELANRRLAEQEALLHSKAVRLAVAVRRRLPARRQPSPAETADAASPPPS